MAIAKDYKYLDHSLTQQRGHREHSQLPKCYQDVLPESPAALPPASVLMGAQIRTVTSPPITAAPALPQALSEPVRVHGELYTSKVFIKAHNKPSESWDVIL